MKNDEGEGTNERMKIVIGSDGSEPAGAALDDLRQAGLPRDAEAVIVSVAEGEMPLLSVSGIAENGLDPERIASAVTYASNAIAQAKKSARLGGERIKSSFPEWGVSAEYLVCDIEAFGRDVSRERWRPLLFEGVISIAVGAMILIWPGLTAMGLLFLTPRRVTEMKIQFAVMKLC
jgi:hypothetical protein